MTWNGIGRAIFIELANAWTDHDRTCQGNRTADHVNGARACEVNGSIPKPKAATDILEPAATPNPSRGDGVNEHTDPKSHQDKANELQAFCHRAGGNGRSCIHKDHLK